MGFKPGDRIVQIDVDTIITGQLDETFDREEDFIIAGGGNSANPCKTNGFLWMAKAYTNGNLWDDFTLVEAAKYPYYEYPDDQGWIDAKLPNCAKWRCGDEVFVFHKPGWPEDDKLPERAKLVTFSGWRSPERFKHLDWVKKHWIGNGE